MGRPYARSRSLSQRGDTIVEVLISVAIIATILGGAFAVAQSSSHMVQSSQEHGYALQQIQAQIERIRSLASAKDTRLQTYGTTFCTYVDSSNVIQFAAAGSALCDGNDPLNYVITVTKGSTDADSDGGLTNFAVEVTWDKLGGGTNRESLVYGVKI